jgi:hypothetical protein
MFHRFKDRFIQRQFDAEELDGDKVCNGMSPDPHFGCTLEPDHELAHLAGIGGGYVIAEWDDNRETDGEVW